MKIALTGASGLVGRAMLPTLRAAGHEVATLGRSGADIGYSLGDTPDLSGFDALIHAAFAHAPGKYRGGEGDDPEGFIARNQTGSNALFSQAAQDGVPHLVFLSSRAVYGPYAPGTTLTETMPPQPDTLYGQIKWATEQHLATLPTHTASLRATGVYAPGADHKWTQLFADYRAGIAIAPRRATELHGADLARAALLAMGQTGHVTLNASDITLDRHTLLGEIQRLTACPHAPPAPDPSPINAMSCTPLHALGWRPGGMPLLKASLPEML